MKSSRGKFSVFLALMLALATVPLSTTLHTGGGFDSAYGTEAGAEDAIVDGAGTELGTEGGTEAGVEAGTDAGVGAEEGTENGTVGDSEDDAAGTEGDGADGPEAGTEGDGVDGVEAGTESGVEGNTETDTEGITEVGAEDGTEAGIVGISGIIDILPLSTPIQLVTQINAIADLSAVEGVPNVVTVTGTATISATLNLNIDPGVTVEWNANLFGSVATSTTALINLSGSGTFIASSCYIVNTGTGNAIIVSGAGAAVVVDAGATIASDGVNGNGIRVSANNVIVDVNTDGIVETYANNENAAIQINNGAQGVAININGGLVVSDEAGYAINDGAGSTTANNNTSIVINSGTVSSGRACAIHSTGTDSVTTVNGGLVTSAGTSVANPTIYMNAGSGDNIIINGGRVDNVETSSTSYTMMTTGNVLITDGEVLNINGRAINLVGFDSTATVSGGLVQATGGGVAISTATTNVGTVENASVIVSGGTVLSASGTAINVTGLNSYVEVSGGVVAGASATANVATINASGANSAVTVSDGEVSANNGYGINVTGANATVTASGGSISAITGTAIRANQAGSSIRVTDERADGGPVGGAGAQVFVLKVGAAITSSGSVLVDGGFVFAYGTNPATAITTSGGGTITWPVNSGPNEGGIVAVWDQAAGRIAYAQASSLDLTSTFGSGGTSNLMWIHSSTAGTGIYYSPGITAGFFPFDKVAIVEDYGLIFDASTGDMYFNIDGSGTLSFTNLSNPYPIGLEWDGNPGSLELTDFSWSTNQPAALTIINGDATLILNGSNSFGSYGPQTVDSFGISAPGLDLTITGDGSLEARGGQPAGSTLSSGISCDNLTYESGTLITRGDTSAFNVNSLTNTALAYTYWTNTDNLDPADAGTIFCTGALPPYNIAYSLTPGDKFVKLSSAIVALVGNTTISGLMETILATQTATITLYGETVASNLTNADVSSWFNDLPDGITVMATATSGSNTFALTFNGTPLEGSNALFDITIPGSALSGAANLGVQSNPDALFDITAIYDLLVSATEGGSVSGTVNGRYRDGTAVAVTATPDSGYDFIGWSVLGASLLTSSPNLSFSMPEDRVILVANFARSTFALTVISGAGGGSFVPGTVTSITANTPPAGKVFDKWELTSGSGTFANANSMTTDFTMLSDGATVTATYKDRPASGWTSTTPQMGDLGSALALVGVGLILLVGIVLIIIWRKKRT